MKQTAVNLNYFKVFMAVFETRSMTAAAELLHLTQSGVSQHIKSLEQELKQPLFTRTGRKLVPTPLALEIYPDLDAAFTKLQQRLAKATGTMIMPEGNVRIGMPVEFGVNVVVPKLAEIGKKYRKLNFNLTLDYTSTLTDLIGRGELDFAYVDESRMDRRFQYEAVASETLLLCGSREYVAAHSRISYSQSYFEQLDYVDYKGSEPILRRWMLHHLKRQNLDLRVRAHILDVQGIAKFIASGLGVGVLPDHVVEKLRLAGTELHVFEGKAKPLRNEIRLMRLKGYPLNYAAETTLKEIKALF
jgi:DNA-binding transcriptional LysR family regulator